jgi:hypothetical protein
LAGLTPAEADTVVRDSYGGAPEMRQVASATVRLFRSAGVLEQPGAREAFAERGLIDD